MLLTFAILAITIVLFVWGKWQPDLVALLSLLALLLGGIISTQQALAGFGDATVVMIAALFVVGEGMSRTGITAWVGRQILAVAGSNKLLLMVVLMAGTALLSAFISNTGTVATLLPAAVSTAWSVGSVPSLYLIPVAFAANSGGLLTLTGTPPNIIVNDALASNGFRPFGYFEFALIGFPLLIVVIGYLALVGRRLLPQRKSSERPVALAQSLGEMAQSYALDGELYRLRVRLMSRLVGQTLEQAALGRDYGVTVLRVERRQPGNDDHLSIAERRRQQVQTALEQMQQAAVVPGPETTTRAGDVLLVKGSREAIHRLMVDFDLGMQPAQPAPQELAESLLSHELGLAEVLLAPRSAYIGQSLSEGHFAEKYDVQVLSIRRGDRPVSQPGARLQFGDALLVRGTWEAIGRLGDERRNFVVVGSPESMARQVVELSPRAIVAVLALAGMVVLMVTGIVPTVFAALLAAVVMVLGGCVSVSQAYRAVSWGSVILIASMIPMSTALQVTGGAELIATVLVNTFGAIGPLALLAGVFVITTAFSQVINNSAAAVLVAPIVLLAAKELGVSPHPLLMAVAVGASAAFLTPIGTTTNLMVMTPGGYRFVDYFKVGLPLVLFFLAASLLLVPLIWPFH